MYIYTSYLFKYVYRGMCVCACVRRNTSFILLNIMSFFFYMPLAFRTWAKKASQNVRAFVALSSFYPFTICICLYSVMHLLKLVKWITHRFYLLLMPSVYVVILKFSWPSLVMYPKMFSSPWLIGIITSFSCLPPFNFLWFCQ